MNIDKDNVIGQKSYAFALRMVRLYKYLTNDAQQKEFVLSRQLLRSGTSIGANVREALRGQSKADFLAKMNIALKEANESSYWIELLRDSEYLDAEQAKSLLDDVVELNRILISIVRTTNNSINAK